MSKKYLFILSLILLIQTIDAQTPPTDSKDYYMSIASFREKVSDTLDISKMRMVIRNGDTLVPYGLTWIEKEHLTKKKYILKDTTFLNLYKSVAFRAISTYKPQHRYWNEDISIYFGESVPKKHRRYLKRFIKKNLGDLDHLSITTTRNLDASNFVIYYDGDFEYDGRFYNDYSKRTRYHSYWKGSVITKVNIKLIPEFFNNEELLLSELLRTFVINLGYFNESYKLGCESVFSNCVEPVKELTLLDKELIKHHYSYGFCIGVNLQTFEEQDDEAREFYRYNPDSEFFVLLRKDNLKK
jgi:hypothetical protein